MQPTDIERLVRAVLNDQYRLTGRMSPLPSERDSNWELSSDAGERFVVKLANADEPDIASAFQCAILEHVRTADCGRTPSITRSLGGRDYVPVQISDGVRRNLRVVRHVEGVTMREYGARSATRRSLGALLGNLSLALQSFSHPGQFQDIDWDIRNAGRARGRLHFIADATDRDIAARALDAFDRLDLRALRHAVIHNDANDWNVLVSPDTGEAAGLIDFGDAVFSPLIAEVAVASAYAMFDHPSPLEAAADVLAGFHSVRPVLAGEVDVLAALIRSRLVISVTKSAERAAELANNPYLNVSEAGAWRILRMMDMNPDGLPSAVFRVRLGMPAHDDCPRFDNWLTDAKAKLHPIVTPRLRQMKKQNIRLDGSDPALVSLAIETDHAKAEDGWRAFRDSRDFDAGVGSWGESRKVYIGDMFASRLAEGDSRAIHLGLDVFLDAGTPLFAPLEGRVRAAGFGKRPLDYGGFLVLEHRPQDGPRFLTLWGHLDPESIATLSTGQHVGKGQRIAALGDRDVNGGWQPHLHFQICIGDIVEAEDIPGVGEARFVDVWAQLFPDPGLFLDIPPETFDDRCASLEDMRARRRGSLSPSLSLSYGDAPLHIVRGDGVWLIDAAGRAYLDCYNNVAHVGHENPRVVAALCDQAMRLNTNTRYLNERILDYADELKSTLPGHLEVCVFTNSGSEANELALRMARHHTGRQDAVVLDWAYHGHTQALIDISPYKYKRAGGSGRPAWTYELPLPAAHLMSQASPGHQVEVAMYAYEKALQSGCVPAAFIAETVPSVGGQIFLPDGFLKAMHDTTRAAGGVTIADEVQVGFGRTGTMWAFEQHGITPDIVTVGKPMGNGHPMAALFTTRDIAERFANGMEYFNTFGGNPVSCAVGHAVLREIQDRKLIARARNIGAEVLAGLKRLERQFSFLKGARGRGLFLGMDVCKTEGDNEPDSRMAGRIVAFARENGLLIGTDGPYDNVLKLRPPMIFEAWHAEILIDCLHRCCTAAADAWEEV